jgi:hypothetical protein
LIPQRALEKPFLRIRRIAGLLLFTAIAFLIQGYHPYAEDAEIYLPGVLKILNPGLFASNADFFGEHAGHTMYPNLIASSARVTHLSLPWVLFLLQVASIFLLLVATRSLAAALFENEMAHWAAVALMATLLTLPIAGTALYVLDQYPNPRNLAAFAGVFAVAEILRRRYLAGTLWLAFAALVHPLMASFAIAFCMWLVVLDRYRPQFLGVAAALPFGITLDSPPPAYHEVALRQPYFYIQHWEWYEWLGLIGPVILFWMLARFARRRNMNNLELVSRAIIPFVLIATAAAILLSIPARLEALARIEPLRCLALTYMLLIVIGGGLLGQYVLQARIWRWLLLFVPLALGMVLAQRQLFSASSHIEWPWAQPRNPWAQAFDWIRVNTPQDALFALNPNHMALPGEDEIGFRARAERSRLADTVKDKGAASMFPPLSTKWLEQVQDAKNWESYGRQDYERLRQKYGVSWVVVEQPGPADLDCPYQNAVVRVCRIG